MFFNASHCCLSERKFTLENTIERHRSNEVGEWFSLFPLLFYLFPCIRNYIFGTGTFYWVMSVLKNDLSCNFATNAFIITFWKSRWNFPRRFCSWPALWANHRTLYMLLPLFCLVCRMDWNGCLQSDYCSDIFFFCSCNQKTYVDESSFAVSFFRPKRKALLIYLKW